MINMQFTGKIYGEVKTIIQVQKRTAKKLFDNGETIFMQSCNFHPFGVWSPCYAYNKNNENSNGETFEDIVNSFEYYNCANNETGKYASFYR